jgi:hypothetical protein
LPFLLASSDTVGYEVRGGSTINLSFGVVADNPIGVHVEDSSIDLLAEIEVEYVDNVVIFDGQTLPIPKPSIEWNCDNGEDDDGDGAIDFCDNDCVYPTICQ